MEVVTQMTWEDMKEESGKIIPFPQQIQTESDKQPPSSEIIIRKKGEKSHKANYIREESLIDEIKSYLLHHTGKYGYRNYMIFLTGIETGRRCGDILKLKVSDVYNGKDVYNIIEYDEQKTGIAKDFAVSEAFCKELKTYILRQGLHQADYLFPTQKPNEKGEYIMKVRSFYNILQRAKRDLHLDLHLSTHSMRKTFARHHYDDIVANPSLCTLTPLDMVQQLLGHKSDTVTWIYLDLQDDERAKVVNNKTFSKGVDNL